MRRRLAVSVIFALVALCDSAIAGQIWTDGNGDGLPDSGPIVASPNSDVTFGVWIDAQSFNWTNFLAYVEWSSGCMSYVSASYVISGGSNFPVDDFSHPRAVGFGAIGYTESGVDHIGNVTMHIDTFVSCCVSPIVDVYNPYYVFSQLGAGASYMLFSSNPGTCYDDGELPGACCFSDGSCQDLISAECIAAGGTPQGSSTTCSTTSCPPATSRIWTDGNGDGLPDSGPPIVTPGTDVTFGVWFDAQSFSWTNFLAYIEWGDCMSYVSASYVITGGPNFPIDDFSHPRGIGFGGTKYAPRSGVDHIGDVTVRLDASVSCCVAPIIDIKNPYAVFSQLGAGESYMLFSSNPGTCYSYTPDDGACCFCNFTCQVLTPEACAAQGGTYLGDGTDCSPNPCAVPTAACCLPDGACVEATPCVCEQIGGVPQSATTCSQVQCPAPSTEACCFANGTCADRTPANCAAQGGTAQGPGTSCATAPCPPAEACCLANGTCADRTPSSCAAQGGTPQGPGSSCSTVTCPMPTGACCIAGQCTPDMSRAACQAAGGSYRGDGTTCGPPDPCLAGGCPASIPRESGERVAGASRSQLSNNIQDLIAEKNANLSGNVSSPPEIQVGGETCANATPISVPSSYGGNTCSRLNDYDEACPYTGSTSGDEVYVISGVSGQVTFDLCNSEYDTKIYVYQGSCPGTLVACNDDACNDPSGNPFRSIVTCVNLSAANTYYVVVDGYFGDCGVYCLSTSFSTGCPAACDAENCPPGSILEGEPVCGPNYVDAFNGGCNSSPNVFSPLPCDVTVCGASGTYSFNGVSYRDTDWYAFNLPVAGMVTATLCGSFDVQLAAIDGNIGCGFLTILCGPVFASAGQMAWCTYPAPAGANWIFAAPSAFTGVPCGSPYLLSFDDPSCATNATESKTWGQIKGMFR